MTPQTAKLAPAPAIADEFHGRLEPHVAASELAELKRLADDPLRGLGSGIPTPRSVREAA